MMLKSHEPGSSGGFNEVDRIANGMTGIAGTVPGGTNDAGLCTWKPITSRSTNALACTVTVVGRVISIPARDNDTCTVLYRGVYKSQAAVKSVLNVVSVRLFFVPMTIWPFGSLNVVVQGG